MDYCASDVQIDEDLEGDSGEESGPSDEDLDSDEEGDDDDEEDGSEDEDDDEEDFDEQLIEGIDNEQSSSISDGDQERECCPICLNRFRGQELGTPESCEHTFCFECIQEWSKNINTCPVDRTEFNYIRMRDASGGRDLKRVRVKVLPKEPEDAFQEGVTLCEICHNGDREDRLLLCDGCDLAFHCECLDPPLFYIPIEEWFCPSCSGVFQNRAVAGPSHSRTRRVIPRTRASEAVRSRVRNLRTTPSSVPRSRSVSGNSRSTANYTPKKRKRRTYRRTYKKVVQLARTIKSVSGAGKSKVSARGDTVVLTLRRRRRRKRKRLSKNSLASSKSLPIPSAQQRIAKRLGISKPPTGSAIPQVKQASGSRTVTRTAKMPTHSLFGDRNQLMDFNENFNEDLTNAPSTSSSLGRRISGDSQSSSTSSSNILDSIMAGQKLLHSKSENIVIKTDGSLVLKKSDSNKTKSVNSIKTSTVSQSSRTPMSIALAKEGVKSLVLPSNKTSYSSRCIGNTSQTNSQCSNILKSSFSEKVSSKIISASNQQKASTSSTSSKLYSALSTSFNPYLNEEQSKRSALSAWKIPKKNKEKYINDKKYATANKHAETSSPESIESKKQTNFKSGLLYKSNDAAKKSEILNNIKKENTDQSARSSSSSTLSKSDNFIENYSVNSLIASDSSNCLSDNIPTKVYVKKEIMSDEETNSNSCFQVETVPIKQEVLSDEETNIDYCDKRDNPLQTSKRDCGIANNDQDGTDSGSETDAPGGIDDNIQFGNSASESEDSNFDFSQSIIDSVSYDTINTPQQEKLSSRVPDLKIKEEPPSDTEDYSQSIVSDTVPYFESRSVVSHSDSSGKYSAKHIKNNGTTESLSSKFPCKSKMSINNSSQENELPCTQPALYPVSGNAQNLFSSTTSQNSSFWKCAKSSNEELSSEKQAFNKKKRDSFHSDEEFPATQVCYKERRNSFSSDEEFPATQVCYKERRSSISSDEEFPATQVNSYNETTFLSTSANQTSFRNRGFKDLPETQVIPSTSKLAPLPSTQLSNDPAEGISNLSNAENLSSDDDSDIIPATQVFSAVPENQFKLPQNICAIDLPSTQILSVVPENPFKSPQSVCAVDLPATQMCDTLSVRTSNPSDSKNLSLVTGFSTFPETQILNDTSDKIPATHVSETSKDIVNLHNTQDYSRDNDSADLPATQVSDAFLTESSHIANENKTKSSSNKLLSNSACMNEEEKDPVPNLSDIISNIKQVVNSYICGVNTNSTCLNNNPNKNSGESGNLEHNANDLESNLNCNDESSELSSTLDNNEINNVAAETRHNNHEEELNERTESQHNSSDSEDEELSHEKLKEIISKTTQVDSPKKIGVHRHLPQVITVKPVKGQPRPKLPNRRTFSFEEAAKLEGHNVVDAKHKLDESRLFENSTSNSNEAVKDNIPSTQKTGNTFDIPLEIHSGEIAHAKNDLPSTRVNVFHEKKIDIPETQPVISATHVDDWDLPGTQAALWQNNDLNIPETQPASWQSSDLNMPETQAAPWQNDDLDIPETERVATNETVVGEHLHANQKTNKSLNDDLNSKKLKKSIQFITVKSNASVERNKEKKNASSKNDMYYDCQSLMVIDPEDLPATQMYSDNNSVFVNEKVNRQYNSSGRDTKIQHGMPSTSKLKNKISDSNLLPNQKIHKSFNNSVIENKEELNLNKSKKGNNFCAVQSNVSHKAQKEDIASTDSIVHCGNQEFLIPFDPEDLPATQMCNYNESVFVNEEFNQQCNSSGSKEKQTDDSAISRPKNKVSDTDVLKKIIISEIKKGTKNHSKELKRSNKDESSGETLKRCKYDENSLKNNVKQNQNSNTSKISDHHINKLCNNKTVTGNSSFEKNNVGKNNGNEIQKISIKQEKYDAFDFKAPLPVTKNKIFEPKLKSFSALKIKSERIDDADDLIPPTQLAVFSNFCEDSELPATQVANFDEVNLRSNCTTNFLHEADSGITNRSLISSTDIKKEVLSDDEVSVIELDVVVKKEVITIDDDDDDLTNTSVTVSDDIALVSDNRNTKLKVKKEKCTVDYDMSNVSQTSISNSLNCDIHKNHITIKVEKDAINKNSIKNNDSSAKTKNTLLVSKSDSKNTKSAAKCVSEPQVSLSPKEVDISKICELEATHSKAKELKDRKKCKASKNYFFEENNKRSAHENDKQKNRDIKCNPKDTEKPKTSKNSHLNAPNKQEKHNANILKSKSKASNDSYKYSEKSKSTKDSSVKGKGEQKSLKESFSCKSKEFKRDQKDSNHQKVSKDRNKHKEFETVSLSPKIRCGSTNSNDSESDKDIKHDSIKEQRHKKYKDETLRSKSVNSNYRNESKGSSKEVCKIDMLDEISNGSVSSGHTRSSSEKENNSSNKNSKDIIITLKSAGRKRLHEPVESRCDAKKQKYEKLLDCELYSGDDISQQSPIVQNGSLKNSNSGLKLEANCDTDNDSISSCTIESLPNKDLMRISKQELKEEIANEVKMVLKPFYSTGLISKDDYKEIMRRAVPKIFVNCHNTINPEKIRKLVLSYVSLLSKSSS